MLIPPIINDDADKPNLISDVAVKSCTVSDNSYLQNSVNAFRLMIFWIIVCLRTILTFIRSLLSL